MIAAGLDSAENEVEALVGIILIQPNLEIRRLSMIREIDRAPFDVKNAIRCAARNGSKDAAAAGEVCTAFAHDVSAIIAPETENGEIKRPYVRRCRQTGCGKTTWLVDSNEIKAAVRVNVHPVKRLVIQ